MHQTAVGPVGVAERLGYGLARVPDVERGDGMRYAPPPRCRQPLPPILSFARSTAQSPAGAMRSSIFSRAVPICPVRG